MGAAEKEVPLTRSLHPANSRGLSLFPKTSRAVYRDFIKALESGLLARVLPCFSFYGWSKFKSLSVFLHSQGQFGGPSLPVGTVDSLRGLPVPPQFLY